MIDRSKKGYFQSLTEEEIKKELNLVCDSQTCPECGQDHSFKNSFENVNTSMDDFLKYFGNNVSGRAIAITGGILC
jgi:hypothetical protein